MLICDECCSVWSGRGELGGGPASACSSSQGSVIRGPPPGTRLLARQARTSSSPQILCTTFSQLAGLLMVFLVV